MKAIFFFLFLFSHTIGMEASSLVLLERSGRTILSHGGTAYLVETKQVASTGPITTFRIIDMAGMRVSFVKTSSSMSSKFMRMIYKTNSSLRAGFKHQDIIMSSLLFKIMLNQSWVITIFKAHFIPGDCFVSTSGPCFEAYSTSLSTLHVGLSLMTAGIKTMTFTSTELSSMVTLFITNHGTLNNTPLFEANSVLSKFIAASVGDKTYHRIVYPEVRGFPYHGVHKNVINSFTLQDCEKAIQDWRRAPVEVFIIDDINHSDTSIVDAVLPLWQAQLPRTDYIANGNATGFLTLGEEIIIPCQGGVSGDKSLLLTINLGPLSDKSLIAADLVITQFQTYANAKGKLLNSGVTYRCEWAPCAGCAVVMIQLEPPSGGQILTDKTNQIGMIREAFQQFRANFTLQAISTNLSSNWSDSLGTNQQNKNLFNWFLISLSSEKIACVNWWNETLNNESAFEDLKNLALTVAAGTAPVNLYQQISDIIQTSFLPSSRRFDLWIFEKA